MYGPAQTFGNLDHATMLAKLRGADLIARVLAHAGLGDIYSLSGNHIMPLYDALFDTKARIIHTRHEAAAVHMADAHARLTGSLGVALVTGGQGHTNAVAALTTAHCAEAPLLLLSGHAPIRELGRGAFQELGQVELARPVTKAAWMVEDAALLGHDVVKAARIAASGRPGPVHLSLPSDLLEASLQEREDLWPAIGSLFRDVLQPSQDQVRVLLQEIAAARRPLLLAGPMLCTPKGRRLLAEASDTLGVPVVGMESPRGINDPSLGAFAEVLTEADLIVLMAKPLDFTLRFGDVPTISASARFAVIDPDRPLLDRATLEKRERLALSVHADADATLQALTAAGTAIGDAGWLTAVTSAISYRPTSWSAATSQPDKIQPIALMRELHRALGLHSDAIFISDGGEIGQWAQAGITAERRIINGVAGSIGAALPFALAARVVDPTALVVSVMGDGTFGFHMAEIETAVRHKLPFVCIIGNDARWNAEYQIQVRAYGHERAHGCQLAPTRYDQVAIALGAYGECVRDIDQIAPALQRAIESRAPAVLNVMIEGLPAPVIRRT